EDAVHCREQLSQLLPRGAAAAGDGDDLARGVDHGADVVRDGHGEEDARLAHLRCPFTTGRARAATVRLYRRRRARTSGRYLIVAHPCGMLSVRWVTGRSPGKR